MADRIEFRFRKEDVELVDHRPDSGGRNVIKTFATVPNGEDGKPDYAALERKIGELRVALRTRLGSLGGGDVSN